MESRSLRYFVAVAEELNFTRAAERLGIASPPLSRAIRKLEDDLGVTLLNRSTRSVELTPAGAVLLEQGRLALESLDAAGRIAQRADDPEPKVVLAVKADTHAGVLDEILERYAEDPAALPVAIQLCGWGEHARLLRRGEADAALVYLPFDSAGIDFEPVASQDRVVAVAAGHPLAQYEKVSVEDLGLAGPEEVDAYIDRVSAQYKVRDLPQLLAFVELGQLITVLPEYVVDSYPRTGLVYRPLIDAPPSTLAIAWPRNSRSLAVAALVRAAVSDPRP
jgi:DNA-binding transcriptional LysR family regulator